MGCLSLRFLSHAIRNPPSGYRCEKFEEEIGTEAKKLLNQLEDGSRARLRLRFVSCWHENYSEYEALWRLFPP